MPSTAADTFASSSSSAAEQRFLASRQQRSNNSSSSSSSSSRKKRSDKLYAFWEAVKVYLGEWTQRLENLLLRSNNVTSTNGSNEEDKRRIQLELSQLGSELQTLRKHCLSSPSSIADELTASSTSSTPYNATTHSVDYIVVPEEIPMSDIRILHVEFAKCKEQLDLAKQKLLPKVKFVFARYRKAKLLRQQQKDGLADDAASTSPSGASSDPTTKDDQSTVHRNSIHSLADSKVVVDCNGVVSTAARQNDSAESDTVVAQHSADSQKVSSTDIVADGSSPIILRNLQHCILELNGVYPAVHIVNVSNSTVCLENRVPGAIHVTACRRLEFRVPSAHQLRLHESTHTTIHVNAMSGGAILEDCRGILFISLEPDSLDIKDFNCLQSGIVSPNFTVERATNSSNTRAIGTGSNDVTTEGSQKQTTPTRQAKDNVTSQDERRLLTATREAKQPTQDRDETGRNEEEDDVHDDDDDEI